MSWRRYPDLGRPQGGPVWRSGVPPRSTVWRVVGHEGLLVLCFPAMALIMVFPTGSRPGYCFEDTCVRSINPITEAYWWQIMPPLSKPPCSTSGAIATVAPYDVWGGAVSLATCI